MIMDTYRSLLKDRSFVRSVIVAFIFLALSLVINYYTGTYATEEVSNPVTDIILNNIPLFDVDGIFVYSGFLLIVCIFFVGLREPRRIPLTVKAISLFYVIRSIFVSLTHIAPFPTHAVINPESLIRFFNFDGQLFFSGHVGLPFLMALVFWNNKPWRIAFICLSVLFGAVVLMGHLHYSIDVF